MRRSNHQEFCKSVLCLYFIRIITMFNLSYALDMKIGGIFGPKKDNDELPQEQIIFELAMNSDFINNVEENESKLQLNYICENLIDSSSLSAENTVCDMLNKSIIAIFGPPTRDSISVVKSICDNKEIPHIQTRYDLNQHISSCGINLYPHPSTLSKAYADIIKKWEWKNFVIIYEDNESLVRISDLLKPENNGDAGVRITQLPKTNNFRNLFQEIRKWKETNILLDCSIQKLPEVLKQAQQKGLMIENYNYIITNLDLYTLDLEQYKYSGVNITGFRLISSSKLYTQKIIENYNLTTDKILVEAALMHDAVKLFKKTLQQFQHNPNEFRNDKVNIKFDYEFIDSSIPTYCYDDNSWKSGFSIINAMKATEMFGLTGLIKFDNEGYRTNIELQIIELTENGIEEKGIWNTSKGVRMIPHKQETNQSGTYSRNFMPTFNVIISMTRPYGMLKPSPVKLEGNDQYEGFAVDLIYELSLLGNFKYKLKEQKDGSNGEEKEYPNGTKIWDGMIGALLNYEADIAIADLTISEKRETVVEFSLPFMNLGIAILYITPQKENPSLFSFLFPFSNVVWLLVITAYIGMSLQFYIMARLSPYEWRNPYPCIENPEELENQFTLSNSFWYTIGALMQQGSEIAPISPSTRIAAGFWWFFTLIMVSSYTANLAAFLTVENEVSPFNNAQELAKQDKIVYGAKKSGTTKNFFKESKVPEYQHMYNFMMKNPHVMTDSNEEGVKRVIDGKGNYAFLMESSAIEYEKEQHCELAQIGQLLDNKNYGIAMRKKTQYSSTISNGVLVLQEKGVLSTLTRKWWKEKYSRNCQVDKTNDATTLKLGNVGGVFLVLIAGVGIAFLVMLFELLTNLRNKARDENVPLQEELTREIKFIMKCRSVKPTHKPDEKSLLSNHSETNNSVLCEWK